MKRGLLASETELAQLHEHLGRSPFNRIYDTLRKRCSLLLETKPIAETAWRSAYEQGQWHPATAAAASAQGRIFDLAIAHHIDRNGAYRDRAVEELKSLLNWSTWVEPAHKDMAADLCTAEACTAVAVGLDLLAEEMSEPDKLRCIRALRERGFKPYVQAVQGGAFWYSCYHNWNAVVNGGIGLAALLLADEEPLAKNVVEKARLGLNGFFNALGREGGWDEGLGYWGYAMRYLLLFGEALDHVGHDGSIFHHRGMDTTGLFPVYFAPHGQPISFGDLPVCPAYGTLYLFVKRYGLKEMAWWLDRYAFRHDIVNTGYSDAGLALLFRPIDWENEPAPDLHPVKAFNEIGWAAMADKWPTPSMYAALKTGDLSANHAQLDMNSLQVMVDGEVLLNDPGNPELTRDYFQPESRYGFYEVQPAAHNTLMVGDRGHRIDAVGSIIEAQDAPEFRWIAGDGGLCMGDDVQFIRHVVMPIADNGQGEMIVVLDEVRSAAPEKVTAAWHTSGTVQFNADSLSGVIQGQVAKLHFAFVSPAQITAGQAEKPLGKRVDRCIRLSATSSANLILISIFSRQKVGKAKLKTVRGDVVLMIDKVKLYWKASRRYLKLESVET